MVGIHPDLAPSVQNGVSLFILAFFEFPTTLSYWVEQEGGAVDEGHLKHKNP